MAKSKNSSETPLMQQYYGIKQKHPDAILLFRVGDFYETFAEDAKIAAKTLGIVLTQRKNGAASSVELAGFPHHSLNTYLPKLVRAGFRVAICDQLEDPKLTKKIVKRGITELVTPGVAINDHILDQRSNNFLAGIYLHEKNIVGIAFLDISTGEFLLSQNPINEADKLIQNFGPKEILVERKQLKQIEASFGSDLNYYCLEDWVFKHDYAYNLLTEQFSTKNLKGFGVENLDAAIISAGVCLHYLKDTRHDKLAHINQLSRIDENNYVWLDKFTIRNLELFSPNNEGGIALIDIIDQSISAMGARLMKRWLALPLKNPEQIRKRQQAVSYLLNNSELQENLINDFENLADLERLVSKISTGKINPRELLSLQESLILSNKFKKTISQNGDVYLKVIAEAINPCMALVEELQTSISPEAPNALGKGRVFNTGISKELDELREILGSGKNYLQKIVTEEKSKTEINSLKLGFNNVFGYYLEVSNTHKAKVPEEWIRKQTLVNAERYITEELKEYETKVLGAEEKINSIEASLYAKLIENIQEFIPYIQQTAQSLAVIDCLLSFARIALKNNYVKPEIDESLAIKILDGRHPVIEKQLKADEKYIPNDIFIDDLSQQILMITGPNMAGKSAILRQTALIILMGQIGSFVPAKSATYGYIDKIFTRVGASDNISQGESTFMVEMIETASIMNNISERSLILLDEIGRGTSTYDGISIAWSIAEFLHQNPSKPKTLFATHYHELNEMSKNLHRIKNFNVSVKEIDGKILFMRKLKEGGSEHSFGIHVAKLAGMPRAILNKAEKILEELEQSHKREGVSETLSTLQHKKELQLSFFQLDDPVLIQIKEDILNTDINTLTPVEALMKLNEIKKIIGR